MLGSREPARAQDASIPRPTVYAWFPARFGSWATDGLDWEAITHVCFRSVVFNGDGTLQYPAGNPPRGFVRQAHDHGVKVCVLAWSNNRQDTDSYLARYPQQASESLLAYVRQNELDGVNYDDERWGQTNGVTGGPTSPLLSRFLHTLNDTFKSANSSYHVSFATPPVISANDRFGVHYVDWPDLIQAVDAVIPMLYTVNPPSIGWTTNPQPLAGGGFTAGLVARDTVTVMSDFYMAAGWNRNKLLLGISSLQMGGYEFRCRTAQRNSPILAAGTRRPLDWLEQQAAIYGRRWDYLQQSAWYCYKEADHFVQGWYDDAAAFRAKLDYANSRGLGGVGMWVLDGTADHPEMWPALRAAFLAPREQQPPPG